MNLSRIDWERVWKIHELLRIADADDCLCEAIDKLLIMVNESTDNAEPYIAFHLLCGRDKRMREKDGFPAVESSRTATIRKIEWIDGRSMTKLENDRKEEKEEKGYAKKVT